METLENFDLLSVGIAVAAIGVLGFTVYFNDRKSITNQAFLFFSVITAFWGAFTYLEYNVAPDLGLWFLRFSLFCAVGQAYSLYIFFSVFPEQKHAFNPLHRFVLVPVVATTALLTLTPYVLGAITRIAPDGTIAAISNGPIMPVFGLIAVALIVWGLVIFFRKTYAVQGDARRPYVEIQIGTLLTFALIITFNFILPAFFSNAQFVPFGSVFVFPFVAFAAYAILRHGFINVKVAATSVLVFILAIVSFGEIIFSNTLSLVIFRSSVFMLVLIFGINLIRGVLREVEQREKIQKLAGELQTTNERQETLIHFIGHEVKGFLTKDEGAFAAIVEGDFGAPPDGMKDFAERALAETRTGVGSVSSILKAANLKRGTVSYEKVPFDLKALVAEAVERAKPVAEKKGLALSFTAPDASYQMVGDKAQIGDHVIRNLIENAINYTPVGSVAVSLERITDASSGKEKLVLKIQDTGIGITEEDKQRLFTEGGHGKESQKMNVHSTGYGLYIAKQITLAHGGTLRAESEGAGKGATFIVAFPAGQS